MDVAIPQQIGRIIFIPSVPMSDSGFLFSPASTDNLERLLKAWRFWLVMALLGGVMGMVAYALWPPAYRSRATVQVDFNIEEAYTPSSDKQAFYYLEREVRKLQALAFSDAVLQAVAEEVGGVSPAELRQGILHLSQPGEAEWSFYAEDRNAQRAQALASAWARAFTAEVKDAAVASKMLQAFHAELQVGCGQGCADLENRLMALEARARGISPYVEVGWLQVDSPSVNRKVNRATYLLAGTLMAWAGSGLIILFVPGRKSYGEQG